MRKKTKRKIVNETKNPNDDDIKTHTHTYIHFFTCDSVSVSGLFVLFIHLVDSI